MKIRDNLLCVTNSCIKVTSKLILPSVSRFITTIRHELNRPIVDTPDTLHYGIGKCLAKLLNPLTQNEYTVQDSFEAVDKIHKIPVELFDQHNWYKVKKEHTKETDKRLLHENCVLF